jgi:(5-formylfuran-3-yl)methyl phosphate synthase
VKLLVSVVCADEARAAAAGGADIIDVKDPREGALGAPSPRTLERVVAAVDGRAPVSVALGDLPDLPHTAALAARGAAACGVDYVKVGLRGTRSLQDAIAVVAAVADAVPATTAVIAAAYADGATADPPALDPALLPELVRATGIAGALIDTLVKDGRGLYGSLSPAAVTELAVRTRAAEGSFGVAGQLRAGELRLVPADIVGVRSAACRGGDRTATLDPELVESLIAELRAGAVSPG